MVYSLADARTHPDTGLPLSGTLLVAEFSGTVLGTLWSPCRGATECGESAGLIPRPFRSPLVLPMPPRSVRRVDGQMGRQATAVAAERAPEALGQVEEASSHRLARAAADLVAVREVAREAARVAVAMEAAPVADRAPAAGSDCHLACE